MKEYGLLYVMATAGIEEQLARQRLSNYRKDGDKVKVKLLKPKDETRVRQTAKKDKSTKKQYSAGSTNDGLTPEIEFSPEFEAYMTLPVTERTEHDKKRISTVTKLRQPTKWEKENVLCN